MEFAGIYVRKLSKYIEDELAEVFDEVLEYSEKLIEIMKNTLLYLGKIAV
jgi:hypothetical protein